MVKKGKKIKTLLDIFRMQNDDDDDDADDDD